ncbi:hypothetical protein ALC57_09938 [Trachymyrmex cornetzi]|uniref:Uncharacterized protein n=1 Tax=Trachymyrmex cornetzi TaxID=471704 RepID=A0A151J4V3_9HYME|nr:hypothetical protein ALC57_09938 [Trachymyrmex cornetzi]
MYLALCHPSDILDLSAEQLQYIPKIVLLRMYGDYIDYVWNKLPGHLKVETHRSQVYVRGFINIYNWVTTRAEREVERLFREHYTDVWDDDSLFLAELFGLQPYEDPEPEEWWCPFRCGSESVNWCEQVCGAVVQKDFANAKSDCHHGTVMLFVVRDQYKGSRHQLLRLHGTLYAEVITSML